MRMRPKLGSGKAICMDSLIRQLPPAGSAHLLTIANCRSFRSLRRLSLLRRHPHRSLVWGDNQVDPETIEGKA